MISAEASATTSVRVALGDRAYDILIGRGLIAEAGRAIAERLPRVRAAIVTDETVGGLHLAALTASLDAAGIESVPIVVAPGEGSKNFATLETVVRAILAARLERGDIVVAFGGGVVGDLTGFAAAITRRGMRFVQIPTSLLAQVDSSVGGKTGINTAEGKNLVGSFHQPDLVIADTGILDTLSPREFRAGYAEVAKYGLIDDPAFFAWLEQNWQGILSGGPEREHAVATSCRAKAKVVAADEHETGERALLNLGHTFGHALESATGYSQRLVHGEGVAIGMVLAHEFSARMNLCSPDDGIRVEAHLKAVGLPTRLSDVPGGLPDAQDLMKRIAQDKKVSRGTLTFILTHGVGKAFIAKDVPPAAVEAFLNDKLAG
ncbi:3-dehydroquinate synthase [Kaistia nematophila]|uniref:3-dehydroquinate synthase n=1 Tax=Kaistia nematophila TaxID=2994654 RepID=A0A9X3IMH9_9HYPH|nr:3-dehydroquinate synthase [Kaistia nematophila]MCX5571578.1 3-dehydroquinate synthase [Kaistia nematophila]